MMYSMLKKNNNLPSYVYSSVSFFKVVSKWSSFMKYKFTISVILLKTACEQSHLIFRNILWGEVCPVTYRDEEAGSQRRNELPNADERQTEGLNAG